MFSVIECIGGQHDIRLVLLAALVCVAGAWTVMGLFQRTRMTKGPQRLGWLFLTAVAAGSSIWCTHFIGVLAYKPTVPVTLDPVLTIFSLLIAIGGSAPGSWWPPKAICRCAWARSAAPSSAWPSPPCTIPACWPTASTVSSPGT